MIEAFAVTGWLAAFLFLAWALRLAWRVRQANLWAGLILRGGSRPSRDIAQKIIYGETFPRWEQLVESRWEGENRTETLP